CLQYSSTPFTF
nr:immunoglobulin light chain junction region [Macaca mulatta]